jgi:hypothetical protein
MSEYMNIPTFRYLHETGNFLMFQIITVNREQAATNIIIINIILLLFAFSINVAQPSYFLYSSFACQIQKKLGKAYEILYL